MVMMIEMFMIMMIIRVLLICTRAFIVCALQSTSDDKQLNHHHRLSVESYLDVIERIRPVIIELERQKRSIVIVCHIAIIR
jgi:broad specificity phosphatase PhoE